MTTTDLRIKFKFDLGLEPRYNTGTRKMKSVYGLWLEELLNIKDIRMLYKQEKSIDAIYLRGRKNSDWLGQDYILWLEEKALKNHTK